MGVRWLLAPLLVVAAVWVSHRRARAARRAFHTLEPSNRELLVKGVLFVVHNGAIEKGQTARGYVRKPAQVLADLLTLEVRLVDEALRRLIEHGYLNGVRGGTAWHLTTHIETTPKGRRFHEEHFGDAGGVLDLSPLGLVVLSGEAPAFPSLREVPDMLVLPRTEDPARPPQP